MEIDEKNITKIKVDPDKTKNIKLTIRINKNICKFLNDKNIIPTGLFNEALRVIGYK